MPGPFVRTYLPNLVTTRDSLVWMNLNSIQDMLGFQINMRLSYNVCKFKLIKYSAFLSNFDGKQVLKNKIVCRF